MIPNPIDPLKKKESKKASMSSEGSDNSLEKDHFGGIPADYLKDKVQEDAWFKPLRCNICKQLLWHPMHCSVCRVKYCKRCIKGWQEKNQHPCQNCVAMKKEGNSILQPDINTEKFLADIQFECLYRENGCKDVLTYKNLSQHLKQCGFRKRICLICEQQFFQSIIKEHRKDCQGGIRQSHQQAGTSPESSQQQQQQQQQQTPLQQQQMQENFDFQKQLDKVRIPQPIQGSQSYPSQKSSEKFSQKPSLKPSSEYSQEDSYEEDEKEQNRRIIDTDTIEYCLNQFDEAKNQVVQEMTQLQNEKMQIQNKMGQKQPGDINQKINQAADNVYKKIKQNDIDEQQFIKKNMDILEKKEKKMNCLCCLLAIVLIIAIILGYFAYIGPSRSWKKQIQKDLEEFQRKIELMTYQKSEFVQIRQEMAAIESKIENLEKQVGIYQPGEARGIVHYQQMEEDYNKLIVEQDPVLVKQFVDIVTKQVLANLQNRINQIEVNQPDSSYLDRKFQEFELKQQRQLSAEKERLIDEYNLKQYQIDQNRQQDIERQRQEFHLYVHENIAQVNETIDQLKLHFDQQYNNLLGLLSAEGQKRYYVPQSLPQYDIQITTNQRVSKQQFQNDEINRQILWQMEQEFYDIEQIVEDLKQDMQNLQLAQLNIGHIKIYSTKHASEEDMQVRLSNDQVQLIQYLEYDVDQTKQNFQNQIATLKQQIEGNRNLNLIRQAIHQELYEYQQQISQDIKQIKQDTEQQVQYLEKKIDKELQNKYIHFSHRIDELFYSTEQLQNANIHSQEQAILIQDLQQQYQQYIDDQSTKMKEMEKALSDMDNQIVDQPELHKKIMEIQYKLLKQNETIEQLQIMQNYQELQLRTDGTQQQIETIEQKVNQLKKDLNKQQQQLDLYSETIYLISESLVQAIKSQNLNNQQKGKFVYRQYQGADGQQEIQQLQTQQQEYQQTQWAQEMLIKDQANYQNIQYQSQENIKQQEIQQIKQQAEDEYYQYEDHLAQVKSDELSNKKKMQYNKNNINQQQQIHEDY